MSAQGTAGVRCRKGELIYSYTGAVRAILNGKGVVTWKNRIRKWRY